MDWQNQRAVEPEVPGPYRYCSQQYMQPEQSGLPVSDEVKDSRDAEVGLVEDQAKKNSSPDVEDERVSENTLKVDAMETDAETEADKKKTEGDKKKFEEKIEVPGELAGELSAYAGLERMDCSQQFPLSTVHVNAPGAPNLPVHAEGVTLRFKTCPSLSGMMMEQRRTQGQMFTTKEDPRMFTLKVKPMETEVEKKTEGDEKKLEEAIEVDDKSSYEYQHLTWDVLRKSITGLVNKVNGSNLKNILSELFSENLIRGGGVFVRSCMKSQHASPIFTHVFAAWVAVVNSKFPELDELRLKRIVLQLLRAYKRNDKPVLLAAVKFIAHLVNHRVAHETIALDLLALFLEMPSEDDVEVAVDFVKECGAVLQNLSPRTLHHIFERFRDVLEEGEVDEGVQVTIEGLFGLRKEQFQAYQGVSLDLLEEQDQISHVLNLDDELDDEASLDVFRVDLNFLENEKYELIKEKFLGEEPDQTVKRMVTKHYHRG